MTLHIISSWSMQLLHYLTMRFILPLVLYLAGISCWHDILLARCLTLIVIRNARLPSIRKLMSTYCQYTLCMVSNNYGATRQPACVSPFQIARCFRCFYAICYHNIMTTNFAWVACNICTVELAYLYYMHTSKSCSLCANTYAPVLSMVPYNARNKDCDQSASESQDARCMTM